MHAWIKKRRSYCDLLGDAGSRSCFDRLTPAVVNVIEPTYAVELGEALTSRGSLSVVPTLVAALEGLAGFNDAEVLFEMLSLLLEREPGLIADPSGREDFESYSARVFGHHAELMAELSSADAIVFHGETFSVARLAEHMLKALAEDEFEPYLRRKFEANTGIDRSGFYAKKILQPPSLPRSSRTSSTLGRPAKTNPASAISSATVSWIDGAALLLNANREKSYAKDIFWSALAYDFSRLATPPRKRRVVEAKAHWMIHKSGPTHRDTGKDLIVRSVKSWAGDISPGKSLILVIAEIPVLK